MARCGPETTVLDWPQRIVVRRIATGLSGGRTAPLRSHCLQAQEFQVGWSSEALVDLIRSAHDRSAVRASTACSVWAASAIDGSSVVGVGVGVFANHRSSIGSSTARSIDTIEASSSIGLMGYREPTKSDDMANANFLMTVSRMRA
jgi:hypothetical protein